MRRLAPQLALLPPLLVGAVLRLWGLARQIPGGDELHTVRAALGRPLAEILGAYQNPDHYIPLAALCRLVVCMGGTITQELLRAPGILAGLAAIVLLPWMAERWVGRSAAVFYAWLLALSPGMVLYSRIARPYAPLVFLSTAAVLAFYRGWVDGERKMGWLYGALATLAAYFHPLTLPLVLAPLGFATADLLLTERERRRERTHHLGRLAIPAATGLALWFLLMHASLLRLVSILRVVPRYDATTFLRVAKLQAGTSLALVAAVFFLSTFVGWFLLSRRDRRLALYLAVLCAVQNLGIVALSPAGATLPLIYNRYTLVVLPILLLVTAVALARLASTRLGCYATAAALTAWLAQGPLATRAFLQSTFMHHNDFVDWSCGRARVLPGREPAFYRELAATRQGGTLIEVPWQPAWNFTRSLYAYQDIHGRPVKVSIPGRIWADSRVSLSCLLPGSEDRWLASGARHVVVHLDLVAEERDLEIPDCGEESDPPPAALAERLRTTGQSLAARLTALWGPPDKRDQQILVWDLVRVRREQAEVPAGPPRAAGSP